MFKTHLQGNTSELKDDDSFLTSINDFNPTNYDQYLYFAYDITAGNLTSDNYKIAISKYYYEPPTSGINPNSPFPEGWLWKVYKIPANSSTILNSNGNELSKIWKNYEYRFEYKDEPDGSVDLDYLIKHVDRLDDLGFGSEILRCIARNLFGIQMYVMDQKNTTSTMNGYMLWLQDDLDDLDTDSYMSDIDNWPVAFEFPPRQFPSWIEGVEENKDYLKEEDYPEMIQITKEQIIPTVQRVLEHNSEYFKGNIPTEIVRDFKFDMDAVSFIRTYDKWYSYVVAPFRKTHKVTESNEIETSYWLHPDIIIKCTMDVYDSDEGDYVKKTEEIPYSEVLTKYFESDDITLEVLFNPQCLLEYPEFITGINVDELLNVNQYPVLEPEEVPSDEVEKSIKELIDYLGLYQEQVFVWLRNFIIMNGLLTEDVDNLTREDLIKINSLFYLEEAYEEGTDNLHHDDKPYKGIFMFLIRIKELLPTILKQTNLDNKYWPEQWLGSHDEDDSDTDILLERLRTLWMKIWNEETEECYYALDEEFWNHNSYQQRTTLWEDFKDALVGDIITVLPEFLLYEQGNDDYIFEDLTVQLDLPEPPEDGILIEHDETGNPFITYNNTEYWFDEAALTTVYDLYRVLDNVLLKAVYFSSFKTDKKYIYWLSTDVEIVVKEIFGYNNTEGIGLNNQNDVISDIYPSNYDELPDYSYLKFFSIIEPWAKTNPIKYERDKEYLWMTRCYDNRFTSLFSGTEIINDQVRHYKTRELLTEFKLYDVTDPLFVDPIEAITEYPNDFYVYLVDDSHCLPLYIVDKHQLPEPEFPDIRCDANTSEEDKEIKRTNWKEWLYNIAIQLKKMTYTIGNQIDNMLLTHTINNKTYYSVDSYLDESITTLLNNINGTGEEYGIYAFEKEVIQYMNDNRTNLCNLYGASQLQLEFTGNRFVNNQQILGNSWNGKNYNVDLLAESAGIKNTDGEYYSSIAGERDKALERSQKWETYSRRYDVFYDYIMNVLTPEYDPNDTSTPITIEMIEDSELEMYDLGKIYKIFYATQDGSVVTDLNTKTGISVEDLLIQAVETILGKSITLLNMCAYVEPIWDSTHEAESIDALIEYSQMLKTVQEERNVIQLEPKKIILKFTQTEKGTIFEILKSRVLSTTETEEISAFYIGLGYGELSDEQLITATPLINQPYRITVIPKFYIEEPLDWIHDDYYSNFLFDQNSNNLDIQFDAEFKARNGTIITKNYEEQNIIGYYIIKTN